MDDLTPITREETFLAAAGGQSVALPEPLTREELFLAKAAGESVEPPEPITRKEMFLNAIQGGGGAQAYTISGTGATHVSVTDNVGFLYKEDTADSRVILMSAVYITLGTQSAASAMYFSKNGSSPQIIFKGTSSMGDTTAVFEYTDTDSHITSIWPVSLTIGTTDYTQYIPMIGWKITVMDNRGSKNKKGEW